MTYKSKYTGQQLEALLDKVAEGSENTSDVTRHEFDLVKQQCDSNSTDIVGLNNEIDAVSNTVDDMTGTVANIKSTLSELELGIVDETTRATDVEERLLQSVSNNAETIAATTLSLQQETQRAKAAETALSSRIDNLVIEGGGTGSVEVLDTLDSTSTIAALSANKGRELKETIDGFGMTEESKTDGYEIALAKSTNTAEKTKVKVPVFDALNVTKNPVGLVDNIFVGDMGTMMDGKIEDALEGFTPDEEPTKGSTSTVMSGGVYDAIQDVKDRTESVEKRTSTLEENLGIVSDSVYESLGDHNDRIEQNAERLTVVEANSGVNEYSLFDTAFSYTKGDILRMEDGSLIRLTADYVAGSGEPQYESWNLVLDTERAKTTDNMGYVILRKGLTFAGQVTKEDTIYEIRYDFDLDGQTVTIPSGCVLKFVGGVLHNGTVKGSDTLIDSTKDGILDSKVSGTFKGKFHSKWLVNGVNVFDLQGNRLLIDSEIDLNSTKVSVLADTSIEVELGGLIFNGRLDITTPNTVIKGYGIRATILNSSNAVRDPIHCSTIHGVVADADGSIEKPYFYIHAALYAGGNTLLLERGSVFGVSQLPVGEYNNSEAFAYVSRDLNIDVYGVGGRPIFTGLVEMITQPSSNQVTNGKYKILELDYENSTCKIAEGAYSGLKYNNPVRFATYKKLANFNSAFPENRYSLKRRPSYFNLHVKDEAAGKSVIDKDATEIVTYNPGERGVYNDFLKVNIMGGEGYDFSNPNKYYAVQVTGVFVKSGVNFSIANCDFEYLSYGIAGGGGESFQVENCNFRYIGGYVFNNTNTAAWIKAGNAISDYVDNQNTYDQLLWSVRNCTFSDIFDSSVSLQGYPDRCFVQVLNNKIERSRTAIEFVNSTVFNGPDDPDRENLKLYNGVIQGNVFFDCTYNSSVWGYMSKQYAAIRQGADALPNLIVSSNVVYNSPLLASETIYNNTILKYNRVFARIGEYLVTTQYGAAEGDSVVVDMDNKKYENYLDGLGDNNVGNTVFIEGRNVGTTSERPSNVSEGTTFYDSTLKAMILWNGTEWVNPDGSALS